jgi:DNA ligase-1
MKGPNEVLPFTHPAIRYPQLASEKLDGFRLLNICGEHLVSPALKPFPNENMASHLDELLTYCRLHRLVTDGEFYSPEITFQELQSITRSHHKPIPSHVRYHIFDVMTEAEWDNGTEKPFINRYLECQQTMVGFPNTTLVEQWHVQDANEAEHYFRGFIDTGKEGIILRQHQARYKHGRCTENEDGMWKFKEFITHDAVILGVEQQERMKDGVERTRNAIGHLERRYEQDLYEPAGMVGAFIVSWGDGTVKVKPGKGHDHSIKAAWWAQHAANQQRFIGKHVEFKYMPHGTMDKPRIGSLVRFRPDLD